MGLHRETSATGGTAPTTQPAPLDDPGNWKLQFQDNFSSTSLDTSKWAPCYPWFTPCNHGTNFGNTELEWYLPSNVTVSGGELRLVAHETPTVGYSKTHDTEIYPWSSGIVTTHNSFHFKYGFVQIVARVPAGDGFWPALWLLPWNTLSPPEIDIMEVWGHDTSQVAFTNIASFGNHQQVHLNTSNLANSFHTYGLDWEPNSITWYLDGKAVDHVTSGVSNYPMYLLMNLAIDGETNLTPNASTPKTGSFDIKSVNIWQH